jgi:hypothetical protein
MGGGPETIWDTNDIGGKLSHGFLAVKGKWKVFPERIRAA